MSVRVFFCLFLAFSLPFNWFCEFSCLYPKKTDETYISKKKTEAHGTFYIDHITITSSIRKLNTIKLCVCVTLEERMKNKTVKRKKKPPKSHIIWYGLVSVVHSFLDWTVYNLFLFFLYLFVYFFYSFFLSFDLSISFFFSFQLAFPHFFLFWWWWRRRKKNLKSHRRITVKSLFFFHSILFVSEMHTFVYPSARARAKSVLTKKNKKREKEIWSK